MTRLAGHHRVRPRPPPAKRPEEFRGPRPCASEAAVIEIRCRPGLPAHGSDHEASFADERPRDSPAPGTPITYAIDREHLRQAIEYRPASSVWRDSAALRSLVARRPGCRSDRSRVTAVNLALVAERGFRYATVAGDRRTVAAGRDEYPVRGSPGGRDDQCSAAAAGSGLVRRRAVDEAEDAVSGRAEAGVQPEWPGQRVSGVEID